MIRALNELRRNMGVPTVPTITGTRTASRKRRKWWQRAVAAGCADFRMDIRARDTMEHHRDLEACPDDMLGEPNARELGRLVRMAKAVLAGFEAPIRGEA